MDTMKTTRFKFKMVMFLLILIEFMFLGNLQVLSQELEEGEGPSISWKWYQRQRAYPFDSIPWGAYENAVGEKLALRQTTGYLFSGPQSWVAIGPKPFEWKGNGVPYTGRANNIKYDPRDTTGNTIYITGPGSGLWKTTNGGQNWINKSGDLPTLSIGAFALDSANNILYVGTGALTIYFGDGLGMRVFKSTDDGITWTSISSGIKPGTSFSKIAISPQDPDLIFAASFHGLYRTTNGGVSWTKVVPISGADSVCTDVCFSPSGNRVYATGASGNNWTGTPFNGIGYWRSTDGGHNFNSVSQSSGFPRYANLRHGKTLCAVSQADEDILYITNYQVDTGYVYLYKSTDGGSTFTPHYVDNTFIFYHLLVRCSDVNPDICFVGFEVLKKTTNGGSSWACVEGYSFWGCPANTHPDFLALDFNHAYPDKITVGNDGGVFSSTNLGSTWSNMNNDLNLSLFWGMASDPYDKDFVACGLHDYGYAYKYPLGGPTYWKPSNSGYEDGGNMVASPFKSKKFVAAKVIGTSTSTGQPIDYSSDGINYSRTSDYDVTTWTVEFSPFTNHPTEPGSIYTVRFNGYWSTQNVYLYKSTNYGVNWGGGTAWRSFARPSGWGNIPLAPHFISISPSNPNTMIMDFGNGLEFWYFTTNSQSRLIKSTDGGLTWEGIDGNTDPIVVGGSNGTPDRFFTTVKFDPNDENILYLTVSGYYHPDENEGHVFKSTNGGYNWTNISGDLPDAPVNDIMIHYPDNSSKQLIIATDAGVYITDASSIGWREVASGFPNIPANKFDYNRLSGKLRTTTWGYGAWEFPLSSTVYVQDVLYITDNVTLENPIVVASGGKLIIGHSAVNSSMAITFNNGANIIVEDGGMLDVSSNVAVTLTSSGTWSGIEFQGTGAGTLKNCTFQNTSTPVVIESSGSSENPHPEILINNCTFYAPVEISNRPDVTVSYCNFSYTSGTVPSVLGVASSGSDDVLITNNTISSSSAISSTGISVVYGSDIVVQKNVINNMAVGISISNTSPFVFQNRITNSTASDAVVGIGFDNSYSATVKQNSVLGYQIGYKLYYSSPLMYEDSSYNTNTSGDSVNSLHAVYISNPRLKPDDDGEGLIWDAGKNMLKTTAKGNGIYMYISSIPDIDYGYNEIYGYDNYLFGDGAPFVADHYVRCNDWVDDPPNSGKFNLSNPANIIYTPYGCTPPGGSGLSSDPLKNKDKDKDKDRDEKMEDNPPQNIIVSYGGGVYDTVKVTSRSFELSMDQQLYGQGVKEELLGNFGAAVTKYKSVIENYQDSTVSINAMKKILICHEKMNADTATYDNLRNYYINLIQSNPSDTAFVKAAKEQAIKTLIKKGSYGGAISQYEDIVSSSNDPYEIFCSELNIIETYMIMIQEGDAPGFTGRLANLKPVNSKDGHKMLLEKLYNIRSSQVISVVPKHFSLSQNYPNPFNPLTKINYSLPNSVKVTIVVYDILGRVVKSLVNEFKEAGNYNVTFDGTGLASGVYFYRIEAGDFVDSKKMVLVK